MSKRQIIILVGIWVIAFLFLGFPQGWQKILAVITGVYLIILAYSLKSEAPKTNGEQVPFVEHKSEPVVSSEQAAPAEPSAPITGNNPTNS